MLLSLLLIPLASAHRPGISVLRVETGEIVLTFARPELEGFAPLADLDAARVLLAAATTDQLRVRSAGADCTLDEPRFGMVEADGIEIRSSVACPGDKMEIDAAYVTGLPAGHRVYVEVDGAPVGVLDQSAHVVEVSAPPGPWQVARRFLGLGVEHIWTGYDHLAFLFGLLLVATRLKEMLFIVTGFTVAHSITLTAAALGLITLPSTLVEAAIAASIVFVGVENLWKPTTKRRVATTFTLGLIHGFGFAGLLTELGLPRGALVLALAAFNGGVELGQAALVTATLPLLLLLGRAPWWRTRAVPALSLLVAAAGLYWLVDRTLLAG